MNDSRATRAVTSCCLTFLLCACAGDGTSDNVRGSDGDGAPAAAGRAEAIGFPRIGCRDSVAGVRRATLVAQRLDEEDPRTQWGPALLRDATATANGFALLDTRAAELVYLSEDLERVEIVAQKGGGPGELRGPDALAYDAANGLVWVLDGSRRVVAFDSAGDAVHQFRLEARASDIAVSDAGEVVLATDIMVPMLERRPGGPLVLLAVYSPAGDRLRVLRTVDIAEVRERPEQFNLPGPIAVRVAAGDDRIVLSFPTSGFMEVYRGGEFERRLRVCVAPEVRDAYAAQLRDFEPSNPSQSSVHLIGDVRLAGDAAMIISPFPTANHEPFMQRVPLDGGTPEGLLIEGDLPIGSRRLVEDRLLTFTFGGNIRLHRLN